MPFKNRAISAELLLELMEQSSQERRFGQTAKSYSSARLWA
jgi:hypothetical protein